MTISDLIGLLKSIQESELSWFASSLLNLAMISIVIKLIANMFISVSDSIYSDNVVRLRKSITVILKKVISNADQALQSPYHKKIKPSKSMNYIATLMLYIISFSLMSYSILFGLIASETLFEISLTISMKLLSITLFILLFISAIFYKRQADREWCALKMIKRYTAKENTNLTQHFTHFLTDGFLSIEMRNHEKRIYEKFSKKITLAEDTNRLAHKLAYSIKIDNEDLLDLFLGSLLIRQLSAFQSFLILLKKGLAHQTEIILRNIAETMFIVGASKTDQSFPEKYVLAEDRSRLKALKKLQKTYTKEGKEDREINTLIKELEILAENKKTESFTTERIAQIAKLSEYYNTLYPLMSLSVHTSPRSLDKALIIDDDENVTGLHYEPITDGYDLHLDYGSSMMLYTLHEIASHFKKKTNEIEKLQAEINSTT